MMAIMSLMHNSPLVRTRDPAAKTRAACASTARGLRDLGAYSSVIMALMTLSW